MTRGPDLGVVGSQGGLNDLKGAFVLVAGTGEVAQVVQHAAEAVAPGADVGVVGSQGGLADLEGAFVLVAGTGEVAQVVQDAAEVFRTTPTPGWSGPRATSLICSARSYWSRAPVRSPEARMTRPRLLRAMLTAVWSGPRAVSTICRARSYWSRAGVVAQRL